MPTTPVFLKLESSDTEADFLLLETGGRLILENDGFELREDCIYTVETEDRTFEIAAEDRAYAVAAEDRAFDIPAEDRTFAVPEEDRTYTVPEDCC